MKNIEFIISLFFLLWPTNSLILHKKYARLRGIPKIKQLPVVPNIVHPPVPDEARLSLDDVQFLQDNAEDPEARPGLFQGDMALTNEVGKNLNSNKKSESHLVFSLNPKFDEKISDLQVLESWSALGCFP